ncbi:alpha/beta-hydrolase [Athelia psychrophila]|uniref:Alpha/beta-hydrolase n=1 Tax=Athelia psychrophila TaxID=1759441 RepID=A0A166C712_9AGAM|nr:alpha/beta-hydrolase [Fibularhizoctonia sp. CBS 109695]
MPSKDSEKLVSSRKSEGKSPLAALAPSECLLIVYQMLKLPGILAYKFPSAAHTHKDKKWSRVVYDITARHVTAKLNVHQIRALQRGTLGRYRKWCKKHKQVPAVDELENGGEGGRLMWLGERRSDKVILFVHGGAFMFPLDKTALHFMARIQERLAEVSLPVGLAILDYSLAPEHVFPTQLLQANATIAHLFASGVAPENLVIMGDSAGANLILQALAHALHPLPRVSSSSSPVLVPPQILPSPLNSTLAGETRPLLGVLLCSPWVNLAGIGGSFEENDKKDIVEAEAYRNWGRMYLSELPVEGAAGALEGWRGYADPSFISSEGDLEETDKRKAQEEWWADLPRLVSRVLVTAGEDECFRDDILGLHRTLASLSASPHIANWDVQLNVEPGVGHDEYFFGFDGNEDRVGDGTAALVGWLKRAFQGI